NSPEKRGAPEIVGRVDGVWVRFKDGPKVFGEEAKDNFVEGGETKFIEIISFEDEAHDSTMIIV
ncbi:MAG: hypothetical protein Q9180_006246, partial [Flavoplaca navasiana]